ncbi:hypothetical protein PENSPDRAFT_211283 [Peniophora sp. CONT]|nr:hypothetical protein PENSPDRAFT_211283 [Peniophora sp. CONT]
MLSPHFRMRTTIENAAQSVLHLAAARPDKQIQARLIRAKARLAAGMRGAAHQDLQMILQLEPEHPEASELLPSGNGSDSKQKRSVRGNTRLSSEVWREVALYLSKSDLRSLLLVPHALSAIASQLLLQTVNLHFGTEPHRRHFTDILSQELDEWHARRSAEILTHLVSDPKHACHVRSLNVFSSSTEGALAFQLAMLENAIPKLVNLTSFGCRMDGKAMQTLLHALDKNQTKLKGLVLDPISPLTAELPNFPLLTRFAYGGEGIDGAPPSLDHIFCGRSIALRQLVIQNSRFMLDGRVPFGSLTSLDLRCSIRDGELLSMIFLEGRHIQCLSLTCTVSRADTPTLSAAFRTHTSALPSLRAFSFQIDGSPHSAEDPVLVPSMTDFIRAHPSLQSLRITNALANQISGSIVWSVLPVLQKLTVLAMELPKDPALAIWLIPKSQLLPGLPRDLKILSLPFMNVSGPLRDVLDGSLPNLKMLAIGSVNHSVLRTHRGLELERWGERRCKYFHADNLGGFGGEYDFAPWVAPLPWHW